MIRERGGCKQVKAAPAVFTKDLVIIIRKQG